MKSRFPAQPRRRRLDGRRSAASAPAAARTESLESRVLLAASLVKDINLDPEGSNANGMVEFGGAMYFSAWDRAHGTELWKSDGTQAGTARVADLVPSYGSSSPASLFAVNGKLLFTAGEDYTEQSRGLWASDGTAAGTHFLKRVQPDPNMLVVVGNLLFFQAPDPTGPTGRELWVSDGTTAGTHLVKDINPGQDSSYLLNAGFAHNGVLLFSASGGPNGSGLWRSDGTEAGTFRLGPVGPGRWSGDYSPSWSDGPGGSTYFAGSDAQHGVELWKTDGTAAGTVLVKDLEPGTASSTPVGLSMMSDGLLYFRTTDANGNARLWKSDGTEAGTQVVAALSGTHAGASSAIVQLRPGGPGLFVSGRQLWRTDGTAAGTSAVVNHDPWAFSANALASGGWFYYTLQNYVDGTSRQELWRSDGTAANTQRINVTLMPAPNYQQPETSMLDFGGKLYFGGTVGGDNELMRLAPTQTTPDAIDVNPARPYGSSPAFFRAAGDRVYFLTHPYGYGSFKVWSTDGTEGGTVQVFDSGYDPYSGGINFWNTAAFGSSLVAPMGTKMWLIGPQPGSQRLMAELGGADYDISVPVVAGNKIFFSAYEDADYRAGIYQKRLWVSNGGAPATPIRTAAGGAAYTVADGSMAAVGNVLYFSGQDTSGNVELWRSDGTAAGTRRVKDIFPGDAKGSWPQALTNVGGTLYFSAMDTPPDPQGYGIRRLYKSDGTDAGTVRVSDTLRLVPTYPNALPELVPVGGTLYLTASDDADPANGELWRTDGTAAGTRRVADVVPGPRGSSPAFLTAVGNRLFFTGSDSVGNTAVYVTDGTASGTRLLSNTLGYGVTDYIYPPRGPYGLTAAGGMLYFVASDLMRGAELWRSDGTPEGTAIVDDINPGRDHGVFWQVTFNTTSTATLAPLGDAVLFSATDGQRGSEVWKGRYAGEPTADAGSGYQAAEGQQITLSAALSKPGAGGPIVSYEWDLNFDGTFEPGPTGATVTYTGGDGPATAFVAVRVTDAAGVSHIDTAPVTLTDRPPTFAVSGAATTTEGAPYALHLSITSNPGSDTIGSWWVNWGDGSATQQVTGSADGSPLTVTHAYANGPARYDISVTATDEDGTYTPGGQRVGVLDQTFGAGGRVDNPFRSDRAVALQGDGRIVTAGGTGDFLLSRYLADGTLDRSFGNGGNVTFSVTGGDDRAAALAVQADGRIVVVGTSSDGADADWVVARFNADGTPDASFGAGGVVVLDMGSSPDAEATDVALADDGKIVVVGTVDAGAAGGGPNFAAIRLNANGSPDATFGNGGTATTSLGTIDRARAVAIQPDGKIILAGLADDGTINSAIGLVRYNADGTPDTTFGTGGKVWRRRSSDFREQAFDLALQPDGKIVVAGSFAYGPGPDELAVLRYNSNGTIDSDFAQGGFWRGGNSRGTIRGVAVAPGGNIAFVAADGLTVGRLTSGGVPDARFGRGYPEYGVNRYDLNEGGIHHQTSALVVQPDGNIVALGFSDGGSVLLRIGAEAAALSVNVLNVPPTAADVGPDRSVAEGDSVSLTATYVDPGVNEPRTFRWHVVASNGQVVADGNAATFQFVPVDEGTYTADFTVTDDSGQSSTDRVVITATNKPPVVNAGADRTGIEGQEISFTVAPPTDAGANDTVTLHWSVAGPGGQPFAQGDGASVRFTPGDDGAYTVTVTATDNDGGVSSDTALVNVADAPPVITLTGLNGAFTGEGYALQMVAVDPSPADRVRSWTIDWGDGVIVTPAGGNDFSSSHVYAAAGKYTIVVSATDDDGNHAAAPKVVTVAGAPTRAGSTLTITGTAFDDLVVLRGETSGQLTVLVNGAPRAYSAGSIQKVIVNLLAGADDLATFGAVPEISADLGDGNDNVIHRGVAAGAGLVVAGGAGADTFQTFEGAGGTATFDGGAHNAAALLYDALIYNGTAGNDVINVTPTAVSSPSGASVSLVGVERITASGGAGNDTINLSDTSTALNRLSLAGNDGDDTFVIGDGVRVNTWSFNAPGAIDGGAGTDSVTYNDQANAGPIGTNNYTLAWYGMSRGPATITHTGVEKATLNTGSVADSIVASPGGNATSGIPELVINAGLPGGTTGDVLNVTAPPGATGGQFTSTGPGAGRYTFANFAPVSFTGIERLMGPDYVRPGVVGSSFVNSPRQQIELRFSEEVRSSIQAADLVVTNLSTGQVVPSSLFTVQFTSPAGAPTVALWVPRSPLAAGDYRATVAAASVQDGARNTLAADYTFDFTVSATVAARNVFYNNSVFDGGDAQASAADDAAIAAGKSALLPGQVSSSTNVTNFARGINGLMFDVAGLAAGSALTADDFDFQIGTGDPSGWEAAPRPTSVTVRRGAGTSGSDRITIIWADGAIKNTWLRVTMRPNANTGLAAADVSYWGNLVGEAGDVTSPLRVTAMDTAAVRRAFTRPGVTVGVSSACDFNRDGRVDAADLALVRNNVFHTLRPITAPPSAAAATALPSSAESTTGRLAPPKRSDILFGNPGALV